MEDNNIKLLAKRKNSIFAKIQLFLNKIFNKHPLYIEMQTAVTQKETLNDSTNNDKNEESKILELQKSFENGEIIEKDLSQMQLDKLKELYTKQIEDLEKSNKYRKIKLLNQRNKFIQNLKYTDEEIVLLELQKKLENFEISETDLSDEQTNLLQKLYKNQIDILQQSNNFRKQKILAYKEKMRIA